MKVDPRGRLLVIDRTNARIQVFDREGDFIEEWTDVKAANDLVIDDRHVVHLAEADGTVALVDLDGRIIGRWGQKGDEPGSSRAPRTASGRTRTATSTSARYRSIATACRSSSVCSAVFGVALIGTGRVGYQFTFSDLPDNHAAAVSASDRCRLVAGVNRGRDKLVEFGERFGVEALYHDYRQMLAESAPEICIVATHPELHCAMVEDCAAARPPARSSARSRWRSRLASATA